MVRMNGKNIPKNFYNCHFAGQEDCLYLNVYVPLDDSGNPPENMPVMVWIHGGAYTGGSGIYDMYGPERFIDFNNVILVYLDK